MLSYNLGPPASECRRAIHTESRKTERGAAISHGKGGGCNPKSYDITQTLVLFILYNTRFTPAVKRGGRDRSNASPFHSHNHPISQLIRDYSCKDDVTDILLLGIFFMHITEEGESGRPTLLTSLRVMH